MFSATQRPSRLNYHGYEQHPVLLQEVPFLSNSSLGAGENDGRLRQHALEREKSSGLSRKNLPTLDGPVVAINIHYGDDETKTVFVHKSYLCTYSKYFRAALNTPAFAETESQEIDLEEMGTEPFDAFNQWLYHQTIPHMELDHLQCLNGLIHIWIFADKYIVPTLANDVMGHLIRLCDDMGMKSRNDTLSHCYGPCISLYGCIEEPSTSLTMCLDHTFNFGVVASEEPICSWFEYAYRNTTEGSRLRRLLADTLAVRFRGVKAHNLPLDLVRDIFESVQQLPDDGGPIDRDPLYYFVNEDID